MANCVTVNEVLPRDIVKVSPDLITRQAPNTSTARLYLNKVEEIIDELGARSAAEQGLKRVLTTSEKLRNSDHTLYLLVNQHADNGNGKAIGLLKVGRKKLFLYDRNEKIIEAEPLCVLDFFVSRECQRHGMGKKLFGYMLQDQNVQPEQLAIDGPSEPMTGFLATHYGLKELIRQNNNFAVTPSFFGAVKFIRHRGIERVHTLAVDPERHPNDITPARAQQSSLAAGRFTAHQRPSQMGKVIHGGGNDDPKRYGSSASSQSHASTDRATDYSQSGRGIHHIEITREYDQPTGRQQSTMAPLNLEMPTSIRYQDRETVEHNMETKSAGNYDQHVDNFVPNAPGESVQSGLQNNHGDNRAAAGKGQPRRVNMMMTPNGHMDLKYYHSDIF